MKPSRPEDPQLTNYLLGELTPAEQEQLESSFFGNDELFNKLIEAETDLIDAYARRELSPEMRARVESRLLADRTGRERLASATALRQYIAQQQHEPPVLGVALGPRTISWIRTYPLRVLEAAAFIFLLGLGGWILHENGVQRQTISRLESDNRALTHQENPASSTDQQFSNTSLPRSEKVVALLTLAGSPSRSLGTESTVYLSQEVSSLRISLILDAPPDSRTYEVSLETADGTVVWRNSDVKSRAEPRNNSVLVIGLPSALLTTGDYIVKVSTTTAGKPTQDISYYSFRLFH